MARYWWPWCTSLLKNFFHFAAVFIQASEKFVKNPQPVLKIKFARAGIFYGLNNKKAP